MVKEASGGRNCALPFPAFLAQSLMLLFAAGALSPLALADYVGFGSVTRGAADCPGFVTYHVKSLADSGAGTLRDAVSQGCRNVVFDVSGEIDLADWLLIQHSYLTIDGASAPQPGITIDAPLIRVALQADPSIGDLHDIIVHDLRIVGAGGDVESTDILELDGQDAAVYNVILDHITAVSASDGTFDVWGEVHDVTVSNSLIRDAIKTTHFSRPSQERRNFTIHRNVYARNNERQIRMRYNNHFIDFTNNVIYGWGWIQSGAAGLHLPSDPGYTPSINVENNVYHYVPPHGNPDDAVILDSATFPGDIFFSGNDLPSGENDAVSTSGRIAIPAYAEVTKLDTSALADSVVPCAGTRYPTAEEVELLETIQAELGGDKSPHCERIAVRPKPPADLVVR